LEVLEQLELQIKQSEKEIRHQMGQEPEVERLQSIPGVIFLRKRGQGF
jgi:transposase